ncbi:unnamed protein product [Protopolystoma xenopodis]|uniref:Uncharacterized protein n=1 Tax=Protopolystoma xenopodis TaxID=117903 RepID=A0A448WA00_9PLAT|nr:unnamed protein product [Protopolystoma xenopodis]
MISYFVPIVENIPDGVSSVLADSIFSLTESKKCTKNDVQSQGKLVSTSRSQDSTPRPPLVPTEQARTVASTPDDAYLLADLFEVHMQFAGFLTYNFSLPLLSYPLLVIRRFPGTGIFMNMDIICPASDSGGKTDCASLNLFVETFAGNIEGN